MRKPLMVSLTALVFALSACDSGNSNGSGNDTPPNDPPGNGNPGPGDTDSSVLETPARIGDAEDFGNFVDAYNTLIDKPPHRFLDQVASWALNGVGAATSEAVSLDTSIECPAGGSVHVTANEDLGGDESANEYQVSISERLDFSDCRLEEEGGPTYVLNGWYEIVTDAEGVDDDDLAEGVEIERYRYEVTGSLDDEALSLTGDITATHTYSYVLDDQTTDPTFEILDEETITYLDVRVGDDITAGQQITRRIATSGTYADNEQTIAIEGTLGSTSLGGYVALDTDSALAFSDESFCPDFGIVRLTGDATSAEVRFGSDTGVSDQGVQLTINDAEEASYADCDDFEETWDLRLF